MRAVPQLSTRYRYPEPGSKAAWGGVGKPGSRRAAGSALGTTVTAFAPSFKIIIWFRDALRTRCTISQCPQLTRQKGEEKLPQKRKENPPDVRRHYQCSQRVPHLYQFKKCATLLRQPLDYIFIWFLARCFTISSESESPSLKVALPLLNCPHSLLPLPLPLPLSLLRRVFISDPAPRPGVLYMRRLSWPQHLHKI